MDALEEILTGGQSFSWTKKEDGSYEAVLNEKVYRVRGEEDFLCDAFLRTYYDADTDYVAARKVISSKDELLKEAVEKFPSLRILRQDPWISTISFILSQNNNIKRIKMLYDRLSMAYGHEVEKGYFSFPTPEELSKTSIAELRDLRVGFRDRFIMDAIEKHDILDRIPSLDYPEAEELLMSITGIGKKVASCILLFGFHRMEAFPVDVWIKKVLNAYYPGKELSYFEPHPALCQQYLFSMARYIKL
ncbi:MAG: DNA lyase [Sphaerochaetaceae bacterium]|nr:DNA lyase [Sphaerochaetaceae bacterium]